MVRVSVVIPTYNRKEFFDQALETVRVQTHEPLECIVVDDGSTDGTREFLESLDYDDLRAIYFDENRGQSVARNAGIEASDGKYVMFLDSDDILYPHVAETLVEAVEDQPEDCVGAFASKKIVTNRGREKNRRIPPGLMTDPTIENARAIGGLSSTMFMRSVLEEVDGFDESLSRRVDIDLYIRILKLYSLLGVDEICCERRIHDSQISKEGEKVRESYRRIAEKHRNQYG